MLARAIQNLAHMSRCNLDSSSSSSRTKVRELDTFDSSDPKKLCTFLVHNDRTKVTFAQSYLKGMVLQWFEPDLLSDSDPDDRPLWMDNWKEFVIELQTTFGPHDPVADAKHELDRLQMKENQRINNALHHHFYTGLPDHIKDEICRVGKPRTLGELCLLAQEVDARYWERKEEIQCQPKSIAPTGKQANPGNNSTQDSGRNKPTSDKTPKTGSNNSSTPDLSNKLGKDGKLTAAECKRCFDLNLCMFCGGNGHFSDKCPKKEAKAKAHAATAVESTPAAQSDSGPGPESKN
ncbi:hypothetical protein ID866_12138 [Astraeus odoratus]|nr:hypothetical protein ID866_12138 [Astraeus odoratus]